MGKHDDLFEGLELDDDEELDYSTHEEEDDDQEEKSPEWKEQLEALNKEKHGLLDDLKKERARRQEMSGRLEQLTNTVNTILDSRRSQPADEDAGAKKISGIPVEFDDDDNAYIPTDKLEELLASRTQPQEENYRQLQQYVQMSSAQQQAQQEAERVKASIIAEDERFNDAYRKYQAARRYVEDKVVEFQRDNNLSGTMTSTQALDYVFDDNAEKAFTDKFPGVDLEAVVLAEDSKRLFRRMLSTLAPDTQEASPRKQQDERFRKVLNKPAGLGSTPNAKGAELSVTERLESISTRDLMDLTDAQVRQLERALAQEEKTGGLTFK